MERLATRLRSKADAKLDGRKALADPGIMAAFSLNMSVLFVHSLQ